MIKRYKLILILSFMIVAAVCLVTAGCKLNESYEDFLNKNGLTASVTYILNEGEFNNHSQVKEINYKAGSKPYEMSQSAPSSGSSKVNEWSGHTFLGWFEVVLNAEGVPLYEDNTPFDKNVGLEEGKIIQTKDVPFDFSKPMEEGQHLFTCGKWRTNSKLIVKLITEGYDVLEHGEKEYRTGDVIREVFIPENGLGNLGKTVFTPTGYTYVSFYSDVSGDNDNRFNGWPIKAEEGKDEVLYAKYLKGAWEIVENTSGIGTFFNSGGGTKNYYLLNDVDCADWNVRAVTNINTTGFSGKFYGNGYKISNLKIRATGLRGTATASLFGRVNDDAEIKDVTFENITANFEVNTNADVNMYFMFTSKAESAVIENVGFGGQMNVKLNENSLITQTTEDRWLFGGLASDSAITGVTVLTGTKCVITDSKGGETVYNYKQ